MTSVDSNILLFAHNLDCPEHTRAFEFLKQLGDRQDVVICELILVELYLLLRNPAVVKAPLSGKQAAEVCCAYRRNLQWRLVENAPVMDEVWRRASEPHFPRRRIVDVRLALTLRHHGVSEFATANVKDFEGLGFERVWNPLGRP